ncbi:putative Pentatricopeptide repeat-containing protein [Quillaja saponaria]|uniref:Pentatricopeptide repeat-containing protein n=1 Tax=Quillaja saponaria TaxID=32244 RepID=A0AAD7P8K9_QUISA|nr:putative Pentatricopeptide repeat-containing protein [Quillaja saponaria]
MLKLKNLRSAARDVVCKCNVKITNFGRHGNVKEARELFDEMPHRDGVSYNSMITVYLKNNYLSRAETLFQIMPQRNIVAESAMIDGYVKAGRLDEARKVFDQMGERNAFSWTSLISGYFNSGQIEEGGRLFDRMPAKNVVSWTTVLVGYARNGLLDQARNIFDLMPEKNIVARTAMIKSYVEKNHFDEAYKVFLEMPERNLYSWNIMISGCFRDNRINEAIQLFNSMPQRNVVSWTTMVMGLAEIKMTEHARKYFDQMPNKDVTAWNAMMNAYANEGLMTEAHELFSLMPKRNIVSWNAIINGYARNDNEGKALKHFILMLQSCFRPNETSLTGLVISSESMLELMQAHSLVIRLGFEHETSLTNALITMYSRNGDLCSTRLAFKQLMVKDVISWTAMILAYSNHGHGHHALQLFALMLRSGTKPDEVTFVGVLSACSHSGLVNKGRRLFDSIKGAYDLNPKAKHYACLIDLLGRAGQVDEAMNVVCKVPPSERDEVVLGSLLGACRLSGDIKMANSVGEKLLELEPSRSGGYVLLANTYAAQEQWDEFAQVRRIMRERNVKKVPGYSQIEVKGKIHVFLVGDRSHSQVHEIYDMLKEKLEPLMREMDTLD